MGRTSANVNLKQGSSDIKAKGAMHNKQVEAESRTRLDHQQWRRAQKAVRSRKKSPPLKDEEEARGAPVAGFTFYLITSMVSLKCPPETVPYARVLTTSPPPEGAFLLLLLLLLLESS